MEGRGWQDSSAAKLSLCKPDNLHLVLGTHREGKTQSQKSSCDPYKGTVAHMYSSSHTIHTRVHPHNNNNDDDEHLKINLCKELLQTT